MRSIVPIVLSMICCCGCDNFIFRDVNCRAFTEREELQWFVGTVGDTLRFKRSTGSMAELVLVNKDLSHRTDYVSDTGCGCYDFWGQQYASNGDTIALFYVDRYTENNAANRYETFYAKIGNIVTQYTEEQRSTVDTVVIEGITFNAVQQFEHSTADALQFKNVLLAKQYGIIRMERGNGEIWLNADLTWRKDVDRSSFNYATTTCQ